MATIQPYRIGTTQRARATDGRSQVIATTHGPIRAKRHTHTTNHALSAQDNHEAAARALAVKISGPTATVRQVSSSPYGGAYDWEVEA